MLAATFAAPAQAAEPERTITALSGTYDVATGALRATATLGAAPTPAQDAVLVIYAGVRDGTSCTGRMLMLTLTGDADPGGSWSLIEEGATAQPTDPRTVSGATVTLGVTAPALAGQAYDCLWARTVDRLDTERRVQPRRRRRPRGHRAAAGADARPDADADPAPSAGAVPKAAKLELTVDGVKPLKRNRWLPVRVEVANVGGAAARKVTLRAKAGRGAKASKRRVASGTLKPGKTRTVKLKLRTKRAASVALTARSGKLRATREAPARPARARPDKPPQGRPRAAATSRSGPPTRWAPAGARRTRSSTSRWAYRGIPKGGLPACTTTTAGVDEDGDPTDGCLPYSYDAKTRSLKIDGGRRRCRPTARSSKVGEDTFWLTPIVKAGTKLAVSLKSIYISGCWPNQSSRRTGSR